MKNFVLAKNIKWNWSEDAACFECPCGEEMQLSEGGDVRQCSTCGKIYRLIYRVEVSEDELEFIEIGKDNETF